MEENINKKKALQELAKRELSNRLLGSFTTYTKSDYEMVATQNGEKIHPKIIEKLEGVERGDIKRLMVFILPRVGKSELASIRFPLWCIGKNPKRKVVIGSYGADLASDFGRKGKQVFESQEYKNVFPDAKLAKDKREGGNWETSKGGGVYTVGVGGALTGKGYDIGIIDDPVKDRLEAESPTTQQRVIDWYTSTFYTRRMNQDSAIILMMTRWSPNDLAGYLLEEEKNGGDKWEVLVIKAIDDNGNPIIWEGKWDEGYMDDVKRNISAKDWAALYQQDPIASSSNIFRLENLRYYLMSDFERADGILKKEDLKCIIYVDPAFSSSKLSDDAVAGVVGKHKITGNYYLIDGYADTSAPSLTFRAILSMYDRALMDGFKIGAIYIENVAINKDQSKFIDDFKSFLKENDRYIIVNGDRPIGKKEDRIKFTLEPKTAVNAIYLRKDMTDENFMKKIERQMLDFPNGKKDDVIDFLTGAVNVLDTKGERKETQTQPKKYFNKSTGQWVVIK